jgi:hypothetical protein
LNWKITYREDGWIVFIKTQGVHTPEDIWQMAAEALEEANSSWGGMVDRTGVEPVTPAFSGRAETANPRNFKEYIEHCTMQQG